MREIVEDLVEIFIQDIDDGCTVMKDDEVQDFILSTTLEEIEDISKLVTDKIMSDSNAMNEIEDIILNRIDKYLHETVKEQIKYKS